MGDERCNAPWTRLYNAVGVPVWRCEKPKGHDGYHECQTGELCTLAWGRPLAVAPPQ